MLSHGGSLLHELADAASGGEGGEGLGWVGGGEAAGLHIKGMLEAWWRGHVRRWACHVVNVP